MAPPSRAAQFTRLHKVLKKQYTAVTPDPNRPVLEHLLFAACLENAHHDMAEQAFATLVHNYFDWNEVRVTSVRELAEVLSSLPDPAAAAQRLKRTLQSVFESTYRFDLEELRKQNLGAAVERIKKIVGQNQFAHAYVVQSALGGHAIPLDAGALGVLELTGMATPQEVSQQEISGLERAIPKNKGIEFGSLLHQLGADWVANPYSPTLHKTLLEIEPDVADKLPKRRAKKSEDKESFNEPTGPAPAPPAVPKEAAAEGRKHGTSKKKDDAPAVSKKGASEDDAAAARKKPAAGKKKAEADKSKGSRGASAADTEKKKTSSGLAKKKPR